MGTADPETRNDRFWQECASAYVIGSFWMIYSVIGWFFLREWEMIIRIVWPYGILGLSPYV